MLSPFRILCAVKEIQLCLCLHCFRSIASSSLNKTWKRSQLCIDVKVTISWSRAIYQLLKRKEGHWGQSYSGTALGCVKKKLYWSLKKRQTVHLDTAVTCLSAALFPSPSLCIIEFWCQDCWGRGLLTSGNTDELVPQNWCINIYLGGRQEVKK